MWKKSVSVGKGGHLGTEDPGCVDREQVYTRCSGLHSLLSVPGCETTQQATSGSGSCYLDSPTVMDWTPEVWAKANPFSLTLLFSGYCQPNGKVTQTCSILPTTNGRRAGPQKSPYNDPAIVNRSIAFYIWILKLPMCTSAGKLENKALPLKGVESDLWHPSSYNIHTTPGKTKHKQVIRTLKIKTATLARQKFDHSNDRAFPCVIK